MRINFKLPVFSIIFFFALLIPRSQAEPLLPSLIDTDTTISMDLQDAALKDVLKIFSIQSGLNFIASEGVKDRLVTLYLDNVPIRETMEKLFKANKLVYEYDEASNIFVVTYADDALEPDLITKVFQLKYRTVSSANLEKEKQNLFNSSSVTSGANSSGRGAIATAPAAAGNTLMDAIKQLLSKNGKINEDSSSNSLIITDLASRFPLIEEVILGLDKPQPQVMLEIEILDVSKNSVDKLGMRFGDTFEKSLSPLSIILGDSGQSDIFSGNLINRGKNLDSASVAGSVVLGNYYSKVLQFLTAQQDTKYLARPRILTLNNETAEIGVTKDEVMTMKMTNSVDAAGNTNVDIDYERATSLALTPEGIGIFLRVTPHINMETGEITMVVNPKTSSATESITVKSGTTESFYRDPEIRSTKSIVKIKDGETVVLGGMIHQEKQESKQKMPLLADIPFLGALFRNRDKSKDLERELLVFITPRIIKEPAPKIAKGANSVNSYSSAQAPLLPVDRSQEIDDLLNTFERERNANGKRKVSQARRAFN